MKLRCFLRNIFQSSISGLSIETLFLFAHLIEYLLSCIVYFILLLFALKVLKMEKFSITYSIHGGYHFEGQIFYSSIQINSSKMFFSWMFLQVLQMRAYIDAQFPLDWCTIALFSCHFLLVPFFFFLFFVASGIDLENYIYISNGIASRIPTNHSTTTKKTVATGVNYVMCSHMQFM